MIRLASRTSHLCVLSCVAVAGVAQAGTPVTHGVYVDADGGHHAWEINRCHTLIWQGTPFMPFGTWFVSHYLDRGTTSRWREDMAALELLRAKGITDYYVGWSNQKPKLYQRLIDWFEEHGCTYGIIPARYDWSPLIGYRVAPGRIEVPGPGRYKAEVKTRQTRLIKAFFLLRDASGNVVQSGEIEAAGANELVFELNPPNGPHKLYYVAVVECKGPNGLDWWSGFDRHCTNVVAFLQSLRLGPGLRLLIDPFYNEEGFYWGSENVLPDSGAFRQAYEGWLRRRYVDVNALDRAWSVIAPRISSFEQAARLIPVMISPGLGDTGLLWDPAEKTAITLNSRDSLIAYDMLQARDETYAELHNRISDVIRQRVDVPIIFKRTGWHQRGFINRLDHGGFDGAGLEVYKAADDYYVPAATYLAELQQCGKTMWYLTTETNYKDESRPTPVGISYPSKDAMFAALDRQMEMGVKGIYLFAAQPQNDRKVFEPEYDLLRVAEQYDWFVEYKQHVLANRDKWAAYSPVTDCFFPVNSPDLRGTGDQSGQSLPMEPWRAPNGIWVVPTGSPETCQGRLYTCLDTPALCRRYGGQLQRAIQQGSAVLYLGLLGEAGAISALDPFFTAERIEEDGVEYQALVPGPAGKVLARTRSGRIWAIAQGRLTIVARRNALKELFSAEKDGLVNWRDGERMVPAAEILGLPTLKVPTPPGARARAPASTQE